MLDLGVSLRTAMGDTESCASVWMPRPRTKKVEVYHEIVRRLRESQNEEAVQPGFEDELWSHFDRLPMSYAIDVNLETPEEVLMHKKLLHQAPTRPAVEVQLVEVHSTSDVSSGDSVHSTIRKVDPQTYDYPGRQSIHPPFASLNPELSLEVNKSNDQAGADGNLHYSGNLYEITISTVDKPKLLSQLTSLLSKIGLNIQEAHAFSTTDGYSLDVFSVDGWVYEDAEQLRHALLGEIPRIERLSGPKHNIRSPGGELPQTGSELSSDLMNIPTDGVDAVEIDLVLLKFDLKIAAGSYGDLFRGTFRSQEVAIKLFKAEYLSEGIQKEFAQEVFIMRRVRHENVVQFIGACTRPPTLCIVTEFMSGGSVYDFMHKQKGIFKLPALLKVAIDVSKGMEYLHHRNIIHRDLKAANLLMDGNEVVKVADFGVARVQTPGGVMTAETGTYRWMAPEVIEHKPYDRKADVFSFGIVLWELLTGKLPYEDMTPLQAAVGVVQKDLRPLIPSHTFPKMVQLLKRCWHQDPSLRPEFSELIDILEHMLMEVAVEERNCKRRTHLAETSEMADKQAVKSQMKED